MRRGARRWTAAAVLAGIVQAAPVSSQHEETPLPGLDQDAVRALPSAVRSAVAGAYEAATAHPRSADAVGRVAMLLHAYEQHALARPYYERAAQLAPDATAWTYLGGVVQAELGEYEQAASSFRRTLASDPFYLPASVRLAETLLAAGDAESSRAAYERLLREVPELALARYGYGRALASLGDASGAMAQYEQAVRLTPEFGAARYVLALAYRDAGLPDRAQEQLEAHRRAGASRPPLADPLLDDVRALTGAARQLIAAATRAAGAGRSDEAIALHLQALDSDPTAAQAHVNLISLYGRAGRGADAERHYRTALQLGSHVADAHYNFGVFLASTGRTTEALTAFRQAVAADPFHVSAHNNLGALLAATGRADGAETHFRQALASDPRHTSARFSLARLLTDSGRPAEAIEHLQKLLQSEAGDPPRYTFALARAWMAAGDGMKALEYAESAHRDAVRLGQADLAVTIQRTVDGLKAGKR